MSTKNETASRIFHSSRRRASGLLVGVLLVVGYFGSAAILIRDYSTASAAFRQRMEQHQARDGNVSGRRAFGRLEGAFAGAHTPLGFTPATPLQPARQRDDPCHFRSKRSPGGTPRNCPETRRKPRPGRLASPLQSPSASETRTEDAMKPETIDSNSQIFRSARRWSPVPFLLAGVLLVAGYVGASAALIDNYTNQTAQVGGPRA